MNTDRDEDGDAEVRAPVMLPANLGAFLFADVGIEPGGMPLTVLSALARLGLDPWDEAGRLAGLPNREAIGNLACSLAALPGTPPADADGVAARLVALLPGRAAPSRLSLPRPTDTGLQAVRRRAAVLAVAGVLTGLALLLAGHLAAADNGAAASTPLSVTAGKP